MKKIIFAVAIVFAALANFNTPVADAYDHIIGQYGYNDGEIALRTETFKVYEPNVHFEIMLLNGGDVADQGGFISSTLGAPQNYAKICEFKKQNGVWYVNSFSADSNREYEPENFVRCNSFGLRIVETCLKHGAEWLDHEKNKERRAAEKKAAEKAAKETQFNNLIAEGDKFYTAKNYDSAKNAYAEARKLNNSKVNEFCDNLVKNGDKLSKEGNYAAATDYYSKAIVMGEERAYHYRGLSYYDSQKYEQAFSDFNQVIRIWPNFAAGYISRGNTYMRLKNYNKAIEDLNHAIKLDPNDYQAYAQRGYCNSEMKNYKQAVKDYDQAIKLNPNFAVLYNNRGRCYNRLQKYEQAIKDCNQAIKLDSNFANPYYHRGFAYEKLNQKSKAISDYKKALELNPNNQDAKDGLNRLQSK